MDIKLAIAAVIDGEDLSSEEMGAVMRQIMQGEATPAQIGGFLTALRAKGETVPEIAGAARVMREFASKVDVDTAGLVDTAGTGGDGRGLFNVSTAACFVIAAAGGRVAKHGNRSLSSSSGSADVLESLGVRIDMSPEESGACIDAIRIGFLFAPAHHAATRHAAGPRKELGTRTLFNLLGPLTNPAAAPNQIMGVYAPEWVEPIAHVFKDLGSRHVLVFHSDDGLDEISIGAPTMLAELKEGEVRQQRVSPEDFGMARAPVDALAVSGPEESARLIAGVLNGEAGAAADMVALNAGAGIYVCGQAQSLADGVARARQLLADGCAHQVLTALQARSRS
ncbi:anthranilate phosphoribosyltransferase [Natronospira proteinivora]|uniref:Anthranilate phosphoribosyltransferase n=1 Tax=Natronospira proteinivora TaxID=1807133 RepID=A0ABT1G8C8_9GAMM|nr:anthranilate phosphoribosyltransferase [Natronospira proteinivora]MCP1727545.1 anthranilate phosphoribosyltransferase [Natronospira proteinivora]